MTSRKNPIALAGFVLLCFAVSAVGGVVTAGSVGGWYQQLNQPGFRPPDWVFGPVWTALYIMMAVAAWLVWMRPDSKRRSIALWLFGVQLALNLLWSILFFGMQRPDLALMELALLLAMIVATGLAFRRLSRPAGLLFVPYILWVGFALLLNFKIWQLN